MYNSTGEYLPFSYKRKQPELNLAWYQQESLEGDGSNWKSSWRHAIRRRRGKNCSKSRDFRFFLLNMLFTFYEALFLYSSHFWLRAKTAFDNKNNKNTRLCSPLTISGLIILSLDRYSIPTWTGHLELWSSRTYWLLQVLAYLFIVMREYYISYLWLELNIVSKQRLASLEFVS